ncbi:MAG: Uma2 family endonuclease [Anaerolineae bacterium]|nr:Uma2 family endonuclease [Anaerolineae bacterium]
MSVVDKPQLMTEEEFEDRYADERVELIRGEVVAVVPNAEHGKIAVLIAFYLTQFALQRMLGWARVETKYRLSEQVWRIPDVSFLTTAREAQIPDPRKNIPFAPEMAIEIISPSETITGVREKMADYRVAGTDILWLVYPDTQEIEVHYLQENRHVRFGAGDTLRLETVLPGFELPLANVFVAA